MSAFGEHSEPNLVVLDRCGAAAAIGVGRAHAAPLDHIAEATSPRGRAFVRVPNRYRSHAPRQSRKHEDHETYQGFRVFRGFVCFVASRRCGFSASRRLRYHRQMVCSSRVMAALAAATLLTCLISAQTPLAKNPTFPDGPGKAA